MHLHKKYYETENYICTFAMRNYNIVVNSISKQSSLSRMGTGKDGVFLNNVVISQRAGRFFNLSKHAKSQREKERSKLCVAYGFTF
jgi:hypothetical protein